MSRLYTVLLITFLCSSVLAEPVTFTCSRPAWDGKVGCEATNAFETFFFHVDSNALNSDLTADKENFRYSKPTLVYNRSRGCEIGRSVPYRGRFKAKDDAITFWLVFQPGQYSQPDNNTRITLNIETMTATLKPAKHSGELTCTRGETISDEQFAHMMQYARDTGDMRPRSATTVTDK